MSRGVKPNLNKARIHCGYELLNRNIPFRTDLRCHMSSLNSRVAILVNAGYNLCVAKKLAAHIKWKEEQVVHFRPKSVKQVEHNFHCGPTDIDLAKTYTYLGFLSHEHNDLIVSAQALAQSAGKALSALLCKTRNLGGGTGFCHLFQTFPYRDC